MNARWRLPLLLISCVCTACAGAAPQTLADVSSDLRLESLPARAHVAVNGLDMGATPVEVHIDPNGSYDLTISTPGFESRQLTGSGEMLLKNREVELVLLPEGDKARPPRGDDVPALSAIAEALERKRDWSQAAEFWHRVVSLKPREPRGHRGLGSCLAKLGQDEQAIREYSQYLFLAPDAPDAARVQKAIDAYRGGIEMKSTNDIQ